MDDPSTSAVTEGFGLMFYNARFYSPYLNHFTQPDSIVPDPYHPQDWDRYSYARNNPLKYTDPSGHVPVDCYGTNYCRTGNTIFFGGSNITDINKAGPSPYDDSPIWTTDQIGRNVSVVPYPGTQYLDGGNVETYGKMQQSIDAQGLLPDSNVNLIAYSAGTESALMYAVWRLENGQDVNSIVLLGPTFETSSMNFDEPDGGWSGVMDDLIEQGVNIYVLDDDRKEDVAVGYQPPTCNNCGAYERLYDDINHHSTLPNFPLGLGWFQGTNNSPRIKNVVYSWLADPQ
jgi:RHS repeat-associated protein